MECSSVDGYELEYGTEISSVTSSSQQKQKDAFQEVVDL